MTKDGPSPRSPQHPCPRAQRTPALAVPPQSWAVRGNGGPAEGVPWGPTSTPHGSWARAKVLPLAPGPRTQPGLSGLLQAPSHS